MKRDKVQEMDSIWGYSQAWESTKMVLDEVKSLTLGNPLKNFIANNILRKPRKNISLHYSPKKVLPDWERLLSLWSLCQIITHMWKFWAWLSRPKSMEHGFRCMTNLLILHNSINVIDSKINLNSKYKMLLINLLQ